MANSAGDAEGFTANAAWRQNVTASMYADKSAKRAPCLRQRHRSHCTSKFRWLRQGGNKRAASAASAAPRATAATGGSMRTTSSDSSPDSSPAGPRAAAAGAGRPPSATATTSKKSARQWSCSNSPDELNNQPCRTLKEDARAHNMPKQPRSV